MKAVGHFNGLITMDCKYFVNKAEIEDFWNKAGTDALDFMRTRLQRLSFHSGCNNRRFGGFYGDATDRFFLFLLQVTTDTRNSSSCPHP